MDKVVTTQTSRLMDQHMINDVGIDGILLMENAARGVAEAVLHTGRTGKCVILIGGGNNGGDGLALMRILKVMGRDSIGVLLGNPESFKGDALKNYNIVKRLSLPLITDISVIHSADIIVDALFGTGLSRPIEGMAYDAIRLANDSSAYRIAVDIPSGMNGDTGEIMGIVFNADETITFQCIKKGLLLTKERETVGRMIVQPIGLIDDAFFENVNAGELIDEAFVSKLLPERRIVSNKGNYGKALIIAGSDGMLGAAVMASAAALRAGAGLTRAYVKKSVVDAFAVIPEVMPISDEDNNYSLDYLLDWADAIGIGCGLGNDTQKYKKLIAALNCGKPLVVDADGLNSMDENAKSLLHKNCILTPHPGEMARLIGCDIKTVLNNPSDIARSFAMEYNCTVLLKSAVSIIVSANGEVRYNANGNAGLAKGGSGDVLTGIITALIAQGLNPFDAGAVGAFILGCSAEKAFQLLQMRSLTAKDVIEMISDSMESFNEI